MNDEASIWLRIGDSNTAHLVQSQRSFLLNERATSNWSRFPTKGEQLHLASHSKGHRLHRPGMAHKVRFELTSYWLTANRSTVELPVNENHFQKQKPRTVQVRGQPKNFDNPNLHGCTLRIGRWRCTVLESVHHGFNLIAVFKTCQPANWIGDLIFSLPRNGLSLNTLSRS